MKNTYDISSTEIELMEFLWEQKQGVTFREVLDYANDKLRKGWKKQTLGTYLKNLQLVGMITVDNSKKNYIYYPTQTRQEYVHQWTKKLVKESYGNSISKFMLAFSGGKKLDKEDADRLRELL